ncbi:MAG: hypothetical protein LBJ77_04150 [Holosporales bacterium]|jgi:hypothetical protein|nr:hypothetical protein [Holosporales bacterium]
MPNTHTGSIQTVIKKVLAIGFILLTSLLMPQGHAALPLSVLRPECGSPRDLRDSVYFPQVINHLPFTKAHNTQWMAILTLQSIAIFNFLAQAGPTSNDPNILELLMLSTIHMQAKIGTSSADRKFRTGKPFNPAPIIVTFLESQAACQRMVELYPSELARLAPNLQPNQSPHPTRREESPRRQADEPPKPVRRPPHASPTAQLPRRLDEEAPRRRAVEPPHTEGRPPNASTTSPTPRKRAESPHPTGLSRRHHRPH